MTEVEIGSGKSARRAYELDDIAVVPSRRTRDAEDVDTSWEIDALRLDAPLLASAAMVTTVQTAIEVGKLGIGGILDLEAIDPDAIIETVREVKDAGMPALVALRPQRVQELAPKVLKADPDLLVVRGRVVSAEHVSRTTEPLNLKRFVREYEIPVIVGGCASYQAALHLMRAGAVGVIAGVRGLPLATAIADAAGARMSHLVETGVYVHVIAGGPITTGDAVAKAIACGADAAVVEAGPADLPAVVDRLRRDMAASGHETVKEFQKADIVVVR